LKTAISIDDGLLIKGSGRDREAAGAQPQPALRAGSRRFHCDKRGVSPAQVPGCICRSIGCNTGAALEHFLNSLSSSLAPHKVLNQTYEAE